MDCITSSGVRRGVAFVAVVLGWCKPVLTSVSASIGVSSIATANDTMSAIATVYDMARMNSPGAPGKYASGINDATIVSVAASTGTASSVGERHAASRRLIP